MVRPFTLQMVWHGYGHILDVASDREVNPCLVEAESLPGNYRAAAWLMPYRKRISSTDR
jgi:hypothetical protein